MLRSLHLTIVLSTASILLIAENASSQLPITQSAVPSSDTNSLICYMQTADGRTLNLNRLCGNSSQVQPEVVVSHVNYEDNSIIGHVVNRSSRTVSQIRVNYEVIDGNNRVFERGDIPTNPQILRPGQIATFQTSMLRGRDIRVTFVEGI